MKSNQTTSPKEEKEKAEFNKLLERLSGKKEIINLLNFVQESTSKNPLSEFDEKLLTANKELIRVKAQFKALSARLNMPNKETDKHYLNIKNEILLTKDRFKDKKPIGDVYIKLSELIDEKDEAIKKTKTDEIENAIKDLQSQLQSEIEGSKQALQGVIKNELKNIIEAMEKYASLAKGMRAKGVNELFMKRTPKFQIAKFGVQKTLGSYDKMVNYLQNILKLDECDLYLMSQSPLKSPPDLKKPSYILAPEGLYCVTDIKKPISSENLVNRSDTENARAMLWVALGAARKPRDSGPEPLSKEKQDKITEYTGHVLLESEKLKIVFDNLRRSYSGLATAHDFRQKTKDLEAILKAGKTVSGEKLSSEKQKELSASIKKSKKSTAHDFDEAYKVYKRTVKASLGEIRKFQDNFMGTEKVEATKLSPVKEESKSSNGGRQRNISISRDLLSQMNCSNATPVLNSPLSQTKVAWGTSDNSVSSPRPPYPRNRSMIITPNPSKNVDVSEESKHDKDSTPEPRFKPNKR